MKSREEIELLKSQWKRDAIWDIEDTEWKAKREQRHAELASMICPIMTSGDIEGSYVHCVVEKCAWWNEDREKCGILPQKEVVVSGGINTHTY